MTELKKIDDDAYSFLVSILVDGSVNKYAVAFDVSELSDEDCESLLAYSHCDCWRALFYRHLPESLRSLGPVVDASWVDGLVHEVVKLEKVGS